MTKCFSNISASFGGQDSKSRSKFAPALRPGLSCAQNKNQIGKQICGWRALSLLRRDAHASKIWKRHIQICNVFEDYESRSRFPKLISDLILGGL
jgi:hypothetical protein